LTEFLTENIDITLIRTLQQGKLLLLCCILSQKRLKEEYPKWMVFANFKFEKFLYKNSIKDFLITNIVNETLLTNFIAFFNLGLTAKNRIFAKNHQN